MSSNDGILLSRLPSPPSSITVGNGQSIPIFGRGTSLLHIADRPFYLNNVLVAPQLTRNLLSVRQLTRDNNCSIEFDASGFSVKDLRTKTVLLRCNSHGDLYTIPHRLPPRCHVAVVSPELWHSRLGHPAPVVVQTLNKLSAIQCNKAARRLCHTCQLGKHARLPFASLSSSTSAPFELVHCDVWTSPVLSISGYKYYLVLVDDFTHYCWTFPLRHKSEVHEHIVQFLAYAHTQFSYPVHCFQADNGTKFLNNAIATLLAGRGILLRTSCPYTSAQNGKAERMLRTLNNAVRTLLIHAAMPPSYWAEALSTAVFLINRRPSSSIHNGIPYHLLYRKMPDYSLLRVFGCLCYPNLSATTPTNCLLAQQRVSSSVTLLPRRVTGALIFPLARSSSLATLFLMRLTFRLRLPSPDRTLLIFYCSTSFLRLPRLPQMLGTRGPRTCRLPPTMPATRSGWTRPSCGMVLPTGCPRRPGRPRLRHLLLRQPVPALASRLLHQPVPALAPRPLLSGDSASTTAVAHIPPRLCSCS